VGWFGWLPNAVWAGLGGFLRTGRALELHDEVRIDHFRAFAAYWSVDAGAATAKVRRCRLPVSKPALTLKAPMVSVLETRI